MSRRTDIGLLLTAGLALGCSAPGPTVLLLSELPASTERIAILWWNERGAFAGSTGLRRLDAPPQIFSEAEVRRVAVAGYGAGQLALARALPEAELEASPLRPARDEALVLPEPESYLVADLLEDPARLTPAVAPALTADWLIDPCPEPRTVRGERLREDGQFFYAAPLDRESALFVSVGEADTELYRVDLLGSERLRPPGWAEGAGSSRSAAAHYQAGRLWLAAAPAQGVTRIYAGGLEQGLAEVTSSSVSGEIAWLAPTLEDRDALWVFARSGVLYRWQPGQLGWARVAALPGEISGRGSAAREPGGSLLVLYRNYHDRTLARVQPDGAVVDLPRLESDRPVHLVEAAPYPILLGYDGLNSQLSEIQEAGPVRRAGTEGGAPTIEPMVLASAEGRLAVSGLQGFLLGFAQDRFCPATAGTLGNDTIEQLVLLADGVIGGSGPLRNAAGPAVLGRAFFE